MSIFDKYLILSATASMYCLGRSHESGDDSIRGFVIVICIGIVWPLYLGYSLWKLK